MDACANPVAFPMATIDEAVLGSIRDLLTPRLIDHVLARVRTDDDQVRTDEN